MLHSTYKWTVVAKLIECLVEIKILYKLYKYLQIYIKKPKSKLKKLEKLMVKYIVNYNEQHYYV